jgi:DNA adenine methylase
VQAVLKWAGGKRWLLPRLRGKLPRFKNYFEPFAGSAGLFFELEPERATVGDMNLELINCYRRIRDSLPSVLRVLRCLQATSRTYYRVRDDLYQRGDLVQRAAYFLYLNKTCWNGLYRVTLDGRFNVPMGRRKVGASIFDAAHLENAARLLKRTRLTVSDFEASVADAGRGDLVYFDPPYVTVSTTPGFRKYNKVLFDRSDDLRLARVARHLAAKGVQVLLSSSADPLVSQMYDGPFFRAPVRRMSRLAGDATKRRTFAELLVSTFPLDLGNDPPRLVRVLADERLVG